MVFQFESFLDLLTMNGHGVYVWSSYVITALALKALVLYPILKRRQLWVQIKRHQRLDNPPQ